MTKKDKKDKKEPKKIVKKITKKDVDLVAEESKIIQAEEPKPLPYPDLAMLEMKRANPYLLEYNGKIIDESTSYYLRFHLRKFFRNKYGEDRMEVSFTQADLDKALADGFKI